MNGRLHHISDWPSLARQSQYSATKLAKLCNVSIRTLERFFYETKATCPKEWLQLQRLMQSKSILLECTSIKEAAQLLGYKHASHFTLDFKKHIGSSPREFLLSSRLSATGQPLRPNVAFL